MQFVGWIFSVYIFQAFQNTTSSSKISKNFTVLRKWRPERLYRVSEFWSRFLVIFNFSTIFFKDFLNKNWILNISVKIKNIFLSNFLNDFQKKGILNFQKPSMGIRLRFGCSETLTDFWVLESNFCFFQHFRPYFLIIYYINFGIWKFQ